jgi:hypothetical protein
MMSAHPVIIGRVSEYDPSNMTIGGKVIFVPPEKRTMAKTNFPPGSVAKVTVEKGAAKLIIPPTAAEMATFTATELAPAAEPIQTPITPPAEQPEPAKEVVIDVPAQVQPGTIISVMIGGTLNLGNYNNVKMEVTATSAEAARAAFQQEISTTVGMMKGIINQVGV